MNKILLLIERLRDHGVSWHPHEDGGHWISILEYEIRLTRVKQFMFSHPVFYLSLFHAYGRESELMDNWEYKFCSCDYLSLEGLWEMLEAKRTRVDMMLGAMLSSL